MKIKYILTLLVGLLGALVIGFLLLDLRSVWLFMLLSFVINFFVAIFCLISVPKFLTVHHRLELILFFVLIASLMPLLGIIILSIMAIALNWFFRKAADETTRLAKIPEFTRDKAFVPKFAVDERKIQEILTSEFLEITEKISALSAINLEASSRANLINRALLSETSDEVRLLAFSFLAKQENEINEQINYLLEKLKTITDNVSVAKIYKYLALLYWKLIDLSLAQEDFFDFIINKSLDYANKALEQFPEDNTLWALVGRIYIMQNDIPKAYDALNRATRLHASDRKILPYLAELGFKNKNYEDAKNYLFMNESLRDVFSLSPIIDFWEKAT